MFENQLAIYIPCRGSLAAEFFRTFNRLKKPEGTIIRDQISFSIAVARNTCVAHFLKTEREYCMFIDSDEVFPRDDVIMRLLEHDKDIVSGLYFNRKPPYQPVILFEQVVDGRVSLGFEYMDESYPKDSLIEVDGCGTGLLLIKRRVLEVIEPPWFDVHESWTAKPLVRSVWSEDIEFCRKAKAAGFKIHLDTGACALHMANIPIGPREVIDEWYKSLQEV